MVLGEPQILGQMKEAVRHAEAAGTLGTLLHKLFQRSFAVAKEVRTNTQVGANVVSMAAASVKLAARIFPTLHEQKVLFIGAGEMIELCATHFAAQGPARIAVANRTLERAGQLAHRFNGQRSRSSRWAATLIAWRLISVTGLIWQERARVTSHCTQMETSALNGIMLCERLPDGTTLLVMPGQPPQDPPAEAEAQSNVREIKLQ